MRSVLFKEQLMKRALNLFEKTSQGSITQSELEDAINSLINFTEVICKWRKRNETHI